VPVVGEALVTPLLQAVGVVKSLGGRAILNGVDLCCSAGEVIVLRGANGCGKTTLLKTLAGIIEPTLGSIRVAGHSIQQSGSAAKAHLGFVPDGLDALPELLVNELIALVVALKRVRLPNVAHDPAWQRWRERLGVNDIASQRLRSLSFGQRKRAFLAAALVGTPALLLLDEPTNGLDPAAVELLTELLTERSSAGLASVLSSNDPVFSERLQGQTYWLRAGKIAVA
jgi:ABC-type multidrug transport system ATPase subunit